MIEPICQRLGHKVTMVANYDNCRIDADVADTYAAAVSYPRNGSWTFPASAGGGVGRVA